MILFIADIHIKLGQKNVPISWAANRYNLFIDKVHKVPHSLLILGGDIFDKLPSLAELQVYFKLIGGCKGETLIYPGNHEASKKNETFFEALKDVTTAINPLVKIVTDTTEYEDFTILPYNDLHKPNSIESCDSHKALFTHVRGEIPPHVKPEVNLDRFDDFPIVYAGDLHAHSNSQRNIVYPGSPMTTSFHRSKVDTGYILIEKDDLTKWKWESFGLPQLLRRTVSTAEEMISTEYDHTIYEIEGDLQQLSTVEVSELLDKKIVKRNSDVTLNLLDKTLAEELNAYLDKVLKLPTETREAALEVFNAFDGRT